MASTRYTGADATPRGWILHDTRIAVENLSATHSSYTEAAPRAAGAGDPITVDTAAVVELSGDQDTEIRVWALNAGLPRLDSGMTVGYSTTAEVNDVIGYQNATHLTGVTCPAFTTTPLRDLTVCALLDGQLVQTQRNTSTGAITLRRFDPSTNAWTSIVPTFDAPISGTARGQGIAQCVDALGRHLLLIRTSTAAPYDWLLLRNDAPQTSSLWSYIANASDLVSGLSAAPDRLRLFSMRNGDLCLIEVYANAVSGYIRQFASADGGATWRQISSLVNATTNLSEAAQAADGSIVIFRLDASNDLAVYRTGSAWVSATLSAATYTFAGDDVEVWAWSDPGGRLFYGSRASAGVRRPLWVTWSDDYGSTWNTEGLVLGTNNDTDCYPTRGQACFSMGFGFILHQSESPGVTTDDSPILLRLGGWQNCVFPVFSSGLQTQNAASWWPIGEPDDLACWTSTGLDGADSITSTGELLINSGAAATRFHTHAPALATTDGAHIFECEVRISAGGTSEQARIESQLSNGANGSRVDIRFQSGQFSIYTNGTLNQTITIDMSTYMQIRMVHRRAGAAAGFVEVFYRRATGQRWTTCGQQLAITASAAYLTSTASWGNTATTGGTATSSRWLYVWSLAVAETSVPRALYSTRVTNGTAEYYALVGKPLTGLPTPLPLAAATTVGSGRRIAYIRGGDGPAAWEDQWTCRPAYEYPIEALHPLTEPSPRRSWRSTADNVIANIAWSLGSGPGSWLSNYVGVAVFGTNVETINVQALVSAVWTTIGTITTTQGFSGLSWARSGRVVRPNGSPAGARYIFRGELVGSYFDFGGGNIGRIVRHTEGIWSTAAGRTVEIEVDTVGAAGASGAAGAIRVQNAVRIFRSTHTKPWEAIRLNIPAQQAYGDYYEIGTLVLGQVVAAGQSHAWGSTQTYNRNAADAVSGDGVPSTRSLGPVVRSWEWSWSDGTDQSRLLDASPTPDYLAFAAVTDGVANVNDAPYLVAGLLEDSASGEVPIVACDYMQDQTTITDRRLFILGRIVGSVGVEHVQGDPEADSVLRVSPVSMREIV
jgi:hypothetical protein